MSDFKAYANSFQAIAHLQLEGITTLLDFLGHPEKDLKFIHIAGTNGKGSVCAFLQEIFTHAGYKCGKYISPNLVSVCERISIDGSEISEAEINKLLDTAEKASEKVKEKIGDAPTQFEIWTASAFCYFKEKKCDIVILETGLGGTRDATNVIPAPLASVITQIAKDHTAYLGNTLSEIAQQKAGIIKKGGICVTYPQSDDIMNVLKNTCREKENPLFVCDAPTVGEPDGMNEFISYKDLKNIKIGISGYHQIENACIAIETALALGISNTDIIFGIAHAANPGRLELLKENLIFDGAHNPNGMSALMKNLKRYFPDRSPTFIIGMMADKDIAGAAEIISRSYENASVFTVGVENNPRSETAAKRALRLNAEKLNAIPCRNIKEALVKAESKLTVICGSLYLYKDLP